MKASIHTHVYVHTTVCIWLSFSDFSALFVLISFRLVLAATTAAGRVASVTRVTGLSAARDALTRRSVESGACSGKQDVIANGTAHTSKWAVACRPQQLQ